MDYQLTDNIITTSEKVFEDQCKDHGNYMFYVFSSMFLSIIQKSDNIITVSDFLENVSKVFDCITKDPDKEIYLKLHIVNLVYKNLCEDKIDLSCLTNGITINITDNRIQSNAHKDFYPSLAPKVKKYNENQIISTLENLRRVDTFSDITLKNLLFNFLLYIPQTPPHTYIIWLKYGGNIKKCNTIYKEKGKYHISLNTLYRTTTTKTTWDYTIKNKKLQVFLDKFFLNKRTNRRLFPSKNRIKTSELYTILSNIIYEKTRNKIEYYDIKYMKEVETKYSKDFRKLNCLDREKEIWDLYKAKCYRS